MSEIDTDLVGKIAGYSIVGIGIAIFAGALIVLGYFVSGLVLSIMWNWFIVSTFDAPSLSILEAIGITMVVGLFTRGLATHLDTEDDDLKTSTKFAKTLARSLILPFITLFFAWIVYQFI